MSPTETDSPAALAESDERELVRLVAAGDEAALRELHRRFAAMLQGMAIKILHDPADAEEVLQEVFLQVWEQADRYRPQRSAVSTWLVMITRSRAIDRLRSRQVGERTVERVAREDRPGHTSPEGTSDVWTRERRKALRAALAELPAEQREVLELAFYRGWTQREIARGTDTPLGTVKTRTLLAMKKLRARLGDRVRELL